MYGHQFVVPGGSNLTIVGDENSILTLETTNEEKGGYSCGINMYCGNLTIDNCTVVASGGTHGLYTKTGPEHGLTLRAIRSTAQPQLDVVQWQNFYSHLRLHQELSTNQPTPLSVGPKFLKVLLKEPHLL